MDVFMNSQTDNPNVLNVIFTSYGEYELIKKNIKEFDHRAPIKIHIFETNKLDNWIRPNDTELSKFDIELYHVEKKKYAELHWIELPKFNISKNVLLLCADEHMGLSKESVALILKCETASFPRRNFVGLNYFKGSGLGENQDQQVRFFKKLTIKKGYSKSVHEFPFLDEDTTLFPDIVIKHFAYSSIFDVIDRYNKYTAYEAKSFHAELSSGYVFYRGIKHFMRRYFIQKGYRDGYLGFMFCALMGLYYPISYAKFLETKTISN
jgi:hypothetical protein